MMNVLSRAGLVLLAFLMPAVAQAQAVRLPPITDSAGHPVSATGTVLVDHTGVEKGTTGNPVVTSCPSCSGGGGGASELHIGQVGGTTIISAASFTIPAGTSTYNTTTANFIANSATAGSVVPLTFTACRVTGGTGMLRRLRVKTPDTGFAAQSVTAYFYRDSPTVTNGDHGAFLSTESNYIGAVSVNLDKHFSDAEKGIGTPTVGNEINFDCASGSTSIYALLVAGGAIVPQGGKAITATVEILVN